MAGSTVTELLDFTGGMNTLVAPHLVSPRESTVLINVDIRLGSLASMPNLEYIQSLANGGRFYEFNSDVFSYENYRDNVTWNDTWYWSEEQAIGKKLADGTDMELGLPTPSTPCDVNEVLTLEGPHTGDFKYTYTFYSTETGIESAPSPLPNQYTTVEAKFIEITNMEALPADADMYRLYRIGGYLPVFTLVDTFPANNYYDDKGDTRVDGRQLKTMYCGKPPTGLKNLTEFNGRFYGSVGTKLYYSALGNPDAWYISDYFIARDTIIAIANSPGGILVMGKFFTMLFHGNQPTDYRVKMLSDQLGCVDRASVAYLGDSAIWLSHRSFVMCNGYQVSDITAHKIDNIRGIVPTGAIVDDSTYYMSFKPALVPAEELFPSDTLVPNLVEGTAGLDEGIIAMDFKRGNGFSYKLITYDNILAIGMFKGEIHVGTGSQSASAIPCDEVMFPDCRDFLSCSGYEMSRLSVYNGQGLTNLRYLSPKLIDGSLATMKQYDKVRIVYTGFFNIKVLFDNGEVVVERDTTPLTDKDGFIIIGIPNKNNLSHFIRFAIEGIGIISTIQYSWKGREILT